MLMHSSTYFVCEKFAKVGIKYNKLKDLFQKNARWKKSSGKICCKICKYKQTKKFKPNYIAKLPSIGRKKKNNIFWLSPTSNIVSAN